MFILDILFPIKCLGGCNAWDVWLCAKCQQQIQQKHKITFKAKNDYLEGLYYICEYKNPLIQKLIHQFKYDYSKEIAEILGQQLAEIIDQDFDYIIPIPLHRKRYLERGFYQAELLAKYINKNKILNNILIRTKNTQAQAQLDEEARAKNTQNAFTIRPAFAKATAGKKILLIDDVYTTGNTLGQAAKILKQKGAQNIWAACVAKG